ncbi:MAG: hypothetical protein HQ567_35305 [Candidatus Nealsonbacteria bacterium]|nr:hypothetical protein [Candidatus Nealsonbacteria bacterium]
MKCDCGLNYVPGHPEDEAYHAQVHAEYLSGPEIPVIRMLSQRSETLAGVRWRR